MARFRLLGRFGAFCSMLALVLLTTGCPQPADPCAGVDTEDGDPCTTDACAADANGAAAVTHTPIENCCEIAADCNDDNACTTDACTQIDATSGAGTCSHVSIGSDCCNDDSDCAEGTVCTNGTCVAANPGGN